MRFWEMDPPVRRADGGKSSEWWLAERKIASEVGADISTHQLRLSGAEGRRSAASGL